MNPADLIEGLAGAITEHPLAAFIVALVAGVFSTATCPCTIPAGIGVVGYVGAGASVAGATGAAASVAAMPSSRRAAWQGPAALAVAFFVGLVLTVGALGTVAAVVGRLLTQWRAAFAYGAAVVTLVAGLAALGGPVLRRHVAGVRVRQRGGVLGALAYGVTYSIATVTTSAGPLILLLTVAAAVGRPVYGAGLSLAYGLGRGVPFLALGLFAGRASRWLERVDGPRRAVEVASGVALLGLSIYFVRFATV
jgi:cytochrome c-type biogenesis protein